LCNSGGRRRKDEDGISSGFGGGGGFGSGMVGGIEVCWEDEWDVDIFAIGWFFETRRRI
jgi:hypothetical protein